MEELDHGYAFVQVAFDALRVGWHARDRPLVTAATLPAAIGALGLTSGG